MAIKIIRFSYLFLLLYMLTHSSDPIPGTAHIVFHPCLVIKAEHFDLNKPEGREGRELIITKRRMFA